MEFPIEIEAFKYEANNVPATLYRNHDAKIIWLLRNEFAQDWFDVWSLTSLNARRQRIFSFKIIGLYSMVVNVLSLYCYSTLTFSKDVMMIQMHFTSRDDLKTFRYEEVFVKKTKLLSYLELGYFAKTGLLDVPWLVSMHNNVVGRIHSSIV